MAGIALGRRRNVLWVPTGCGDAIVAGRAGTQNLQVIDAYNGREHHHVVAVLTNIGRGNMIHRFAHGEIPFMTRKTVRDDAKMVENRGRKRARSVTVVTLIASREMIERPTHGGAIVVTARTAPEDLQVIHPHDGRERAGLMTVSFDHATEPSYGSIYRIPRGCLSHGRGGW